MKSPYTNSLAHTTWECKYHIVQKKKIVMILRALCRRKEVADITVLESGIAIDSCSFEI